MSTEVKVPVLPESVADATVAAWHKQPGDSIRRDENLVDLETDKVVLEVPSPVDGVVEKITRDSGETVISGELLGIIKEGVVDAAAEPVSTATLPSKRLANRIGFSSDIIDLSYRMFFELCRVRLSSCFGVILDRVQRYVESGSAGPVVGFDLPARNCLEEL